MSTHTGHNAGYVAANKRTSAGNHDSGLTPSSAAAKRSVRQHQQLEAEASHASQKMESAHLSATPQNASSADAQATGIGHPLPHLLRRHYEQRLGQDLSKVRIHDDHAAAQQAEEFGAKAFTVGDNIVFGGAHGPEKPGGDQLLSHELTHVAQQGKPGAGQDVQCDPEQSDGIGRTPPSDPFTTMEGIAPEDEHVLFPRNNAELDRQDRATITRLVGQHSDPVIVHVHGYASHEGGEEYNLNLSAHRAVAVQHFIEGLLPAGSTVVAYAHGPTREFGGRRANRRVGIDVLESAAAPSPEPVPETEPETAPPAPEHLPGIDLDLDLQLDLESMMTPDYLRLPSLESLRQPFDLGSIAPLYSQRGLPYSERDARSYEQHYTLWRDRYIQWGLPPDLAAQLAQMGTEKAAGYQLSLEHPTPMELQDRISGTEPTTVPVFNDAMMRWLFEQWGR